MSANNNVKMNGEYFNNLEDPFLSDATFKVDISQKMKIPHKISFSGDSYVTNSNGISLWNSSEALSMHVPERILVVGQHQHLGTRAPPREIVYDNSILPNDPYQNDIRVATPPRTLTLDKYPFPGLNSTAEEEEEQDKNEDTLNENEFVENNKIPIIKMKPKFQPEYALSENNSSVTNNIRDCSIISSSEKLTPAEEVHHLRCQMAKLNRRIMSLELENLNRLQREKILYGMGIAYFLLKTIIWLNRC